MRASIRTKTWGLALTASLIQVPVALGETPPDLSAEQLAILIAETPRVGGTQISPDGQWVRYSVSYASVRDNSSRTEHWLQRLPGTGAASAPMRLPNELGSARWMPSGHTLSFLRQPPADGSGIGNLVRYDVETGTATPLSVKAGSVPVSRDYKWSPSGTFVAFLADLTLPSRGGGLDRRRGVLYQDWNRFPDRAETRGRLFVLDTRSGQTRQLTPDDLRITEFTWSPDESRLAVVVDRQQQSYGTDTDILLVQLSDARLTELVCQPGKDASPLFSPDGRWVAFTSHLGKPSYLRGWPAVVPTTGGEIVTFAGAPHGSPARWNADSRSLLLDIPRDLAPAFMLATLAKRTLETVPWPTGDVHQPHDSNFSVSKNGAVAVFARSSVTEPAEVYTSRLDARGFPRGEARKLTNYTAGFALRGLARSEVVSWTAPDGLVIQGLLITPAVAWAQGKVSAPLPTFVSIYGGPSMVARKFANDSWGGLELAAAVRGYAVLAPNSRGRPGGNEALAYGIRDTKSYVAAPFERDVLSGVDQLIRTGVADPQRLAIGGHSYGGTMTGYAINRTDRFKAAVVYEPGAAELVSYALPKEPGSWQDLLSRDMYGVQDPDDPAAVAHLLEQSPALHMVRNRTPVLLQFRQGNKEAAKYYSALQFRGVPFALFVYDDEHVIGRPAASVDNMTRSLEWVDHFTRGIEWPDARRASEYERWKNNP